MSKRLYRYKEKGQTLVEVLGIAVTVLVVLLIIMWAVDKYRAQETKVSAPSSLTWAQGQGSGKPPTTDALPGSNDLFNAVPQTIKIVSEEKDDEENGSGSFKSSKTAATTNSQSVNTQSVNNKQQSGAVAQGENQSAALVGKPKAKTNPIMDLNSANAAMEAELMAKMMRRSNDAHQLGLDDDDMSAPLTDKNKKDDEKILIPGVYNKKDNQ